MLSPSVAKTLGEEEYPAPTFVMSMALIDPIATLETSTTALLPFNEVSTIAALAVSRYEVFTSFDVIAPVGCNDVSSGSI